MNVSLLGLLTCLALSACADDPYLGAHQELRFTYGPDAQPIPQLSLSAQVDAISVTAKDPEPSDNSYLPPTYPMVDLRSYAVQSSNPQVAEFTVDPNLGFIETTLRETGSTSLVIATTAGTEVDRFDIVVR